MSTQNTQPKSAWHPNVTVSALCERDGKFLLVEEVAKSTGLCVFNQPSGHLENGETLVEAVIREVAEETQRHFTPSALLGLYRLAASPQKTYIRYTFIGAVSEVDPRLPLDPDILAAHWLSVNEIRELSNLRSTLVLRCIDDYLAGESYPLAIIKD